MEEQGGEGRVRKAMPDAVLKHPVFLTHIPIAAN
jgi:hypothetical protein